MFGATSTAEYVGLEVWASAIFWVDDGGEGGLSGLLNAPSVLDEVVGLSKTVFDAPLRASRALKAVVVSACVVANGSCLATAFGHAVARRRSF